MGFDSPSCFYKKKKMKRNLKLIGITFGLAMLFSGIILLVLTDILAATLALLIFILLSGCFILAYSYVEDGDLCNPLGMAMVSIAVICLTIKGNYMLKNKGEPKKETKTTVIHVPKVDMAYIKHIDSLIKVHKGIIENIKSDTAYNSNVVMRMHRLIEKDTSQIRTE